MISSFFSLVFFSMACFSLIRPTLMLMCQGRWDLRKTTKNNEGIGMEGLALGYDILDLVRMIPYDL
jgi:hypothetical protein